MCCALFVMVLCSVLRLGCDGNEAGLIEEVSERRPARRGDGFLCVRHGIVLLVLSGLRPSQPMRSAEQARQAGPARAACRSCNPCRACRACCDRRKRLPVGARNPARTTVENTPGRRAWRGGYAGENGGRASGASGTPEAPAITTCAVATAAVKTHRGHLVEAGPPRRRTIPEAVLLG